MLEIIVDPVFQGVFWSVLGIIVKAYCPAFVPFLGAAKLAQEELIELHNESVETNKDIYIRAESGEKKEAVKVLVNDGRFPIEKV